MTDQADSGLNSGDCFSSDSESFSDHDSTLERLAAYGKASCASVLSKCAPRNDNVQPDVCILSIEYPGKRRRVENDSHESFYSGFHVLRPILMEFSEYFRKCRPLQGLLKHLVKTL